MSALQYIYIWRLDSLTHKPPVRGLKIVHTAEQQHTKYGTGHTPRTHRRTLLLLLLRKQIPPGGCCSSPSAHPLVLLQHSHSYRLGDSNKSARHTRYRPHRRQHRWVVVDWVGAAAHRSHFYSSLVITSPHCSTNTHTHTSHTRVPIAELSQQQQCGDTCTLRDARAQR